MHNYNSSQDASRNLSPGALPRSAPGSTVGQVAEDGSRYRNARDSAAILNDWLDRHAVAIDMNGETVTSLFLADDVVGYRIEGMLISARSSDGVVLRMARRLSCSHHLGDNGIALLQQALNTLREELREQPQQL
ncbi:hypothetical protein K8B33_06395 [Alcanivorax sp. JB21]|uniref:hypothetical protein n=1 Tax=Alcanivorax limicola TaxID=2874102 RepID=UPI001CC0A2E4|nr:hypothetical protein [Alcanivorax limicola]MBZ2188716.1 hypothetical protein [Alcanivorax limicola]